MFPFLQEINKNLLVFLNNFSENPSIWSIVPFLADAPIFFLPIFLIAAWLYYTFREKNISKKMDLFHIFYATCIALASSLIIQQFVHLERPETAIQNKNNLLLKHIPDASFPSDHASVSVAFLVWLYFAGYKKIFWMFLPFVCGMNLSRIIAGVHWPFDILAWTFMWIFGAYISFVWLKKIKFVKKWNSFIIQLLSYIKL